MVLLEVTITRELELQKSGFSVGRNLMITKDRVLIREGEGMKSITFSFFTFICIPPGTSDDSEERSAGKGLGEVSSDIAFKAQKSKAQQRHRLKSKRTLAYFVAYRILFPYLEILISQYPNKVILTSHFALPC